MAARLADIVARVGDALRRAGIPAVVTGGAAASLHSSGTYTSADVDIVLTGSVTQQRLDSAMRDAGFERHRDRYIRSDTPFFVEFPVGPLAIGDDHAIRPIVIRRGRRRFLMLSATDSCRDRLAAFYHWSDRQSLAAAVEIASRQRVFMTRIEAWSAKEGFSGAFEEFMRAVSARRARARGARRTGPRGTGSGRSGRRP